MPIRDRQLGLSVIIVNWKSASLLRNCLSSLYRNVGDVRFEVIVIDNASHDGCGEMLRTEFPSVRFIQSDDNLGFSGANNRAFQDSVGTAILFLNPDTEIVGDAIQRMERVLGEQPDAGIAGPELYNPDGSIQTSCIRAFPTLVNEALDSEWLRQRLPKSKLWGMRALFEKPTNPVPVDAVSGAALMIRRDAFEAIGMFTTAYFMYAEDIDLCFKLKKSGWKTYFVPDAKVIHYGGQSTDVRSETHFAEVVMRESRLTFFRQRVGLLYGAAYQASIVFASIIRLAILGLIWTLSLTKSRKSSAGHSFWKWTHILRWAVGLERWAGELSHARG